MICPLIQAGEMALPVDLEMEPEPDACDCRQSLCAWWIPGADMCAMKALGMQAAAIKLSISTKIDAYEESH